MSVSSLEGSPVPTDLPTKYQKLASEYAKIRAQFGVLKRHVVEEQNNLAEVKETLRVKDQNLRKAEQEIDSLNFRNQQLTKRVTILQNELDAIQNSHKKGKAKHSSNEGSGSVIMEELQKKISENANLVSMLQEQTEQYESEKFKLIQERETLEHELKECKKNLAAVEGTKLVKAENEIKALMTKLNAKENELQKIYNEYKLSKREGRSRNNSIEALELKNKFSGILQNLPVNDLLKCFSDFFKYFDHLYKKCANDKNKNSKLTELIEKNQSCLNNLKDGYSLYIFNLFSNEGFFTGSENLCIDGSVYNLEELSHQINFSGREEITKLFKDIILSFKNHWMKFHSAIKICLSSPSENEDCITSLADVFRSLRSTCDYFSSAFTEKLKSNPLDEIAEKEILTSLSKMSVQSGAIFRKLNENIEVLNQVIEFRPSLRLEQSTSETQSEHCCDHEKQELELMKMTKRVKDLEEQISCLSGATTPRSNNSSNMVQSPAERKGEPLEITNMFGSLVAPMPFSVELEEQESEIKKFYNNRANTLVADRQLAESKVTALKDECKVLQKRLEHSLECRLVLEASVKQAQDTVNRLQEELTTTTTNYETQLSSMSEHMANMNDKLAAQQEQIEQLSYELTAKGTKKGRPK